MRVDSAAAGPWVAATAGAFAAVVLLVIAVALRAATTGPNGSSPCRRRRRPGHRPPVPPSSTSSTSTSSTTSTSTTTSTSSPRRPRSPRRRRSTRRRPSTPRRWTPRPTSDAPVTTRRRPSTTTTPRQAPTTTAPAPRAAHDTTDGAPADHHRDHVRRPGRLDRRAVRRCRRSSSSPTGRRTTSPATCVDGSGQRIEVRFTSYGHRTTIRVELREGRLVADDQRVGLPDVDHVARHRPARTCRPSRRVERHRAARGWQLRDGGALGRRAPRPRRLSRRHHPADCR